MKQTNLWFILLVLPITLLIGRSEDVIQRQNIHMKGGIVWNSTNYSKFHIDTTLRRSGVRCCSVSLKGGKRMLPVQVNYWTLQETKRHNLVTEGQGATALKLQERDVITREKAQIETGRHNIVIENQGWATIAETSRHNQAIEALTGEQNRIAWYNADTNRMNALTNQANLDVNWYNAATNRMNAATNAMAVQYNYDIGKQNAATNRLNAQTNRVNARTNEWNARISEQRMKQDYELGNRKMGIDQQNADTNYLNAQTNQENALTNHQSMENQKWYNEESIKQRKVENFIKGAETFIKGVDTFDKVAQRHKSGKSKSKYIKKGDN